MPFIDVNYELELEKALALIQPMDIIVSRDRSPISWYLRMKTNSDYSHCFLGGPNRSNCVFTTTANAYRMLNAKKYIRGKSFAIYRHNKMTLDKIDLGLAYNYNIVDSPYAYSDIFSMLMFNLSGRDVKHLNTNNEHVFCAESVAKCYEVMDLRLLKHLNLSPWQMTPQRCIEDADIDLIYAVDR